MYGCESWTVKKAERWRIDAFELWFWRRLLRVPWTARRSNQSILKKISPGCSLEGMMLRLKLQYFGPPHAKSWLVGKDSDAGRDWEQDEKGTTEDEMAGWHHWLDGLESEWTLGVGDGQAGLACCDSLGRKESNMTERLNWTELKSNHVLKNICLLQDLCVTYSFTSGINSKMSLEENSLTTSHKTVTNSLILTCSPPYPVISFTILLR